MSNTLLLSLVSTLSIIQTTQAADLEKIVILGGGMAGLTAGYTLKKADTPAVIYEGRDRLGGRTHTHYFDSSKTHYYEEGGTFIDSDHTEAIALAKELDVKLVHRSFGDRKTTVIYNNRPKNPSSFYLELDQIKQELNNQLSKVKSNGDYINFNTHSNQWCYNSLAPYLTNLSPFGKDFIQTYYEDETGSSFAKAPISSLPWLSENIEDYAKLFSAKNNRFIPNFAINYFAYNYTVQGGISTFVDQLRDNLAPHVTVNLSHKLTHIGKENEQYLLTFQTTEGEKQVLANKLIVTLPFSTLREVKIDNSVELSDFQKTAIEMLPYGTNSKIGLPVNTSANIYNEMLYYLNLDDRFIGWPGENALTLMINAEAGKNINYETAQTIVEKQKNFVISEHSSVKHFGDIAYKNWSQDEFSRGSYSTFTTDTPFNLCNPHKDQDRFPGMRQFAEPINNNFFFAGEHTRSDDTVGYIEGAIRSGIQAAKMIKNRSA